jgi:hypothetical protein
LDKSHRYKTQNSVGWENVMTVRIGFKLQVTTTPGFHALYDWWYQTMWLFSGESEDSEDETAMEMHGADALYSTVKSLMNAIWTEDRDAQQDAAHRMIPNAKPWTIPRRSESNLVNGKPLVRIPKDYAHLVDLEWTEDKHSKLNTLVERYTSGGASGAWRVHRWRLACFAVVLGDTEHRNDVSGKWYREWPLDT